MLNIVLTDSVYTPARAHLRWRYEGTCDLCGAESGECMRYVHTCTQTRRIQDPGDMPDRLRYTCNVLVGWVQRPDSREMQGPKDTVAGWGYVVRDGSSKGGNGCKHARWGIFWGADDPRNAKSAAPGKIQIALGGNTCSRTGPHDEPSACDNHH